MKQRLETKNAILLSAKKEFLELGYQKASLRNICKNANVTTGALYFFFENKDDLFFSLVKDVMEDIRKIVQHHTDGINVQFNKDNPPAINMESGILQSKNFVQYMYAHKDEAILLLQKAQGSSVETFLDEIIETMEKGAKKDVEKLGGKVSDYSVHWLTHVEFSSFAQMIAHNLSFEDAMVQAEVIAKFLSCGWVGILK